MCKHSGLLLHGCGAAQGSRSFASDEVLCEGSFLVEDSSVQEAADCRLIASVERLVLHADRLERFAIKHKGSPAGQLRGILKMEHVVDVEVLDSGFAISLKSGSTFKLQALAESDLENWTEALSGIFEEPLALELHSPGVEDPPPQWLPLEEFRRERGDEAEPPTAPRPWDAQEVIHQGTLMLRQCGTDLAHYFILYKGRFEYFADSAGAARGLCLGRALAKEMQEVCVNDYGFTFHIGARVLEASVPPGEDLEEWLYALKRCLTGHQEEQPVAAEEDAAGEQLDRRQTTGTQVAQPVCCQPPPQPAPLPVRSRSCDVLPSCAGAASRLAPIPEQSALGKSNPQCEGVVQFLHDGRLVTRFCRLQKDRIDCWIQRAHALKASAPASSIMLADFCGLELLGSGLILKGHKGGRKFAMHIADVGALHVWRKALLAAIADRCLKEQALAVRRGSPRQHVSVCATQAKARGCQSAGCRPAASSPRVARSAAHSRARSPGRVC